MKIAKISDTITEVDDIVRIEPGHVRKQAIATAELLSDEVTARHYHLPKTVKVKDLDAPYKQADGSWRVKNGKTGEVSVFTAEQGDETVTLYAIDAKSKAIEEGQTMDYIDWKSRERVFYVYLLVDGRWESRGDRPTYEVALSLATDLAATPAAKPKAKAK